MDKRSEQQKDSKSCDDDDVGIHEYGLCNVRQQLSDLWGHASEKVVGLPLSRLATNCYKKDDDDKGSKNKESKNKTVDIVELVDTRGPPLLNISKPNRVF
jgi:hypothetical protein